MSVQIFYRAMCAKMGNGKYAFFTEDGSSNCWKYNWKGSWIRDRDWWYRGMFASVDEFCIRWDVDRYEENGCYRASRGKIRNMLAKAMKRAIDIERVMKCNPRQLKYENGKSCSISVNDSMEFDDTHKSIFLNDYLADHLYKEL